jgi:cytochrome c peroxidase
VGLAVDPERRIAVVLSQFAREVSTIELGTSAVWPSRRIALARPEKPHLSAEAARGRALFHATDDPRISRDGRACASCHPEGRDDSLTWATPDGPRQTIFLAGRIEASAPYGWFGAHGDLGVHLGHTFQRLGGSGFTAPSDKADLAALVAWLGVMKGPSRAAAGRTSPLDAPLDSSLVDRGRRIFDDPAVGCATCHGGGETDRDRHDVGTGQAIEASVRFDTPSLRFLAGSGPFLHDGRRATLAELVEKGDGRMGHTSQLSVEDRAALTAYLETL